MKGANVLGDVRAVSYELEIRIDATPERTWEAMTAELAAWWPASFHVLGPGSTMTLELEAGGRLVERKPDGTSLLWFHVNGVEPGRSISLAGYLFPKWNGPATTLVTFTVEPRAGGSVVRVSDALFGHVRDGTIESLSSGWVELFKNGLGAYVAR